MTKQDHDKFRASFTVLNAWQSGNWERAIKYYFKLEEFTTPEMLQGRELHKKWADETKKTKCLPEVFGGQKLQNPIVEQKVVVELEPWLDFVFIIDCLDAPVLHEYKSGKSSSESYAGSWQTGAYAVGAVSAGFYVDRAEVHHYDQYMKVSDMSILHITDKVLEDSYNWIITISSEMHNYFIVNGLYRQYGGHLQKILDERKEVEEFEE